MKILLFVVENRDEIRTQYAKLLVGLAWTKKVQGIKFYDGPRHSVWKMRKTMIEEALANEHFKDFTHFLFVDTDVIPPPDFIEKLSAHEADMVSGVYYDTTGLPINRLRGTPVMAEGTMEVDVFSMGLSLIKREVLENVPYPQPDPIWKLDADTEFCKLCKEKSYKVLQDFSIRGTHLLVAPC